MAIAKNYRHTQVMTASPMELILMLYDEGVRSLGAAEEGFNITNPDRFEQISNNLLQAQNVITELLAALDMEKGGEIAGNLERLYDFMINHLIIANTEKKPEPITEVKEMMIELREAWQQIAKKQPESEGNNNNMVQENVLFSG